MKIHIHSNFSNQAAAIENIIQNFETGGKSIDNGKRNSIKIFDLDGVPVVVKSFRKITIFNRFIYRYFRKSKAERSYTFAEQLLEKGIGTPQPVAYIENRTSLFLRENYYISLLQDYDFTFRGLNPEIPEHHAILREFVKYHHKIHQNNIKFFDNSSGNTLIKKTAPDTYNFYLVDLNRMKFNTPMPLKERVRNLSSLTTNSALLEIMGKEYARLEQEPSGTVFPLLLYYSMRRKYRFERKKKVKRIVKFWKASDKIGLPSSTIHKQ